LAEGVGFEPTVRSRVKRFFETPRSAPSAWVSICALHGRPPRSRPPRPTLLAQALPNWEQEADRRDPPGSMHDEIRFEGFGPTVDGPCVRRARVGCGSLTHTHQFCFPHRLPSVRLPAEEGTRVRAVAVLGDGYSREPRITVGPGRLAAMSSAATPEWEVSDGQSRSADRSLFVPWSATTSGRLEPYHCGP
jgi:hypothetical protein